MSTVLIVGASRGLGLALACQYAQAGWHVHATTRSGSCPKPLAGDGDRVVVHRLDIRDLQGIARLKLALGDAPLDLMVVAAGTYDQQGGRFGVGPALPLEEVFAINTLAPIALAEAMLDNLTAAPLGRIVFVSSAEGIRGQGRELGVYGESKAVLNDKIRRLAPHWAHYGVIGIALHPGWIATDMGGDQAPISPDRSAEGIRRIADGLAPEHCGGFFDFRGNTLPW